MSNRQLRVKGMEWRSWYSMVIRQRIDIFEPKRRVKYIYCSMIQIYHKNTDRQKGIVLQKYNIINGYEGKKNKGYKVIYLYVVK